MPARTTPFVISHPENWRKGRLRKPHGLFKLDTDDASSPHVAMWPADPRAGERHERVYDSAPVPIPRVDQIAAFRLPHVARYDV
jgi:hypothetical protein